MAARPIAHLALAAFAAGDLERIRHKLAGSDDRDPQMTKILASVLSDGLLAVESASAEALSEGVSSADVVINIVARRANQGHPSPSQRRAPWPDVTRPSPTVPATTASGD